MYNHYELNYGSAVYFTNLNISPGQRLYIPYSYINYIDQNYNYYYLNQGSYIIGILNNDVNIKYPYNKDSFVCYAEYLESSRCKVASDYTNTYIQNIYSSLSLYNQSVIIDFNSDGQTGYMYINVDDYNELESNIISTGGVSATRNTYIYKSF